MSFMKCATAMIGLFTLAAFSTDGLPEQPIDSLVKNSHKQENNLIKEQTLTIKMVPTYGPHGAKRPTEYIQGDRFFADYRVVGLKTTDKKKTAHTMTFDLSDASGNRIIHKSLGSAPSSEGFLSDNQCGILEFITIQPPGCYEVSLTVRDHLAECEAVTRVPITIIPKGTFGATHIRYSWDGTNESPCGWCIPSGATVDILYRLSGCKIYEGKLCVHGSYYARNHGTDAIVGDRLSIRMSGAVTAQPSQWIPLTVYGLPPGRYDIILHLEDKLAREQAKKADTQDNANLKITEANYIIPLRVVDPCE